MASHLPRIRPLVAVEGDRVVRFVTVVHHFPETSKITWMAVHADRRGRASAGR